VKLRLSRSYRRLGENTRQHSRQILNVREVLVGHPLAIAVTERLQLTLVQHLLEKLFGAGRQQPADLVFGDRQPHVVSRRFSQRRPMLRLHQKEAREISLLLRPSLHREKIDELDEEPRLPLALAPDGVDQLAQSGDEAV